MNKIKITSLITVSALAVFSVIYIGSPPIKDSPMPQPVAVGPSITKEDNPTQENTVKSPDNQAANSPPAPEPTTYIKEKVSNNKIITEDNKKHPIRTYKPLLIPNDPGASQWWVTNTKMDQAWDVPAGSSPTLLAVIDTGFALSHEEFSNRWYQNSGEMGLAIAENPSILNCADKNLALDASCNLIDDDFDGIVDNEIGVTKYQNPSQRNCTAQGRPIAKDCNNIDDDNNGLIDDIRGWDFVNFDKSVQAGQLNPAGSGTKHGTYVTGMAAATGNNSKGIAGVDWNTKILPIQVLDDDSYGNTLTVARGIRYAAAQGAHVISLSLGSSLSDQVVRDAVQEAIAKGSIVVAASGNDGCDCIVYPANYPEVVAVGALNQSSVPTSFSSFGANLDILAPGQDLYTTTWSSANQTSGYASGIAGTSLATPIVSGLMTRMLSQQPNASALELIAGITEATHRLSIPAASSRTNILGYGGLNGGEATSRITVAKQLSQLYALSPVSMGNRLSGFQYEKKLTAHIYDCHPGRPGSTPVYELTKSNHKVYSASLSEVYGAQKNGYTAVLLSYGCIQQQHDRPASVRTLDINREFKNQQIKQ